MGADGFKEATMLKANKEIAKQYNKVRDGVGVVTVAERGNQDGGGDYKEAEGLVEGLR